MTASASGQLDIDLLAPEATADPYPLFDILREQDPVHWSQRHRAWILTSHADVSAAFKDPRFSSDRISGYRNSKLSGPDADPDLMFTFDVLGDWMVFKDGADHTRLRRLVRQAFTPRAIERLRDSVTEQANELINGFDSSGHADMFDDFAFELTAGVICDMLGAPRGDRGRFKTWSDQLSTLVSGAQADPERNAAASRGMRELADYIADLVERYTADPADNLLSSLIAARDEGDALSQNELISTGVLLLFAGHETTTSLISSFVLALLRNPAERQRVVDGTVDIGRAVEEILRFDGPAQGDIRYITEDIELGGKTLEAGTRAVLLVNAANRDPLVFDNPNELNLGREKNPHIGFGLGAHYCLGAPLARLEAGVAVPLLFRRLQSLRLAEGANLEWNVGLLNRGLKRLPTEWDTP